MSRKLDIGCILVCEQERGHKSIPIMVGFDDVDWRDVLKRLAFHSSPTFPILSPVHQSGDEILEDFLYKKSLNIVKLLL